MVMFVKAASIVGSLLAILALVIVLLKTLIGFVGFLAFAVKLMILFAFLGLFAFVGCMLYKSWREKCERQ
jgi:hypothetical protein